MIVPTLILATILFASVWGLVVAYRYAVALADRLRLWSRERSA